MCPGAHAPITAPIHVRLRARRQSEPQPQRQCHRPSAGLGSAASSRRSPYAARSQGAGVLIFEAVRPHTFQLPGDVMQQREIWRGVVVFAALAGPVPLAGQVVLTSDAGAFNNYTWRGVTLTNKLVV